MGGARRARRGDRPDRARHLRDELLWAGCAAFARGVHLRPAARRRARAHRRVARGRAHGHRVRPARDPADAALPTLATRAEAVYALPALAGDYRRFLARFAGVAKAFRERSGADPAQAFAIRTLLVHAYRRAAARSPQLLREVLPADWPGAAGTSLCRDFTASRSPRRGAPRGRVRGRGRAPAARPAGLLPALRRDDPDARHCSGSSSSRPSPRLPIVLVRIADRRLVVVPRRRRGPAGDARARPAAPRGRATRRGTPALRERRAGRVSIGGPGSESWATPRRAPYVSAVAAGPQRPAPRLPCGPVR